MNQDPQLFFQHLSKRDQLFYRQAMAEAALELLRQCNDPVAQVCFLLRLEDPLRHYLVKMTVVQYEHGGGSVNPYQVEELSENEALEKYYQWRESKFCIYKR